MELIKREILTSLARVSLGAKCWVRGAVGGQFPRNLN